MCFASGCRLRYKYSVGAGVIVLSSDADMEDDDRNGQTRCTFASSCRVGTLYTAVTVCISGVPLQGKYVTEHSKKYLPIGYSSNNLLVLQPEGE